MKRTGFKKTKRKHNFQAAERFQQKQRGPVSFSQSKGQAERPEMCLPHSGVCIVRRKVSPVKSREEPGSSEIPTEEKKNHLSSISTRSAQSSLLHTVSLPRAAASQWAVSSPKLDLKTSIKSNTFFSRKTNLPEWTELMTESNYINHLIKWHRLKDRDFIK